MLLPTSLVGSYPQPDWLIDREALSTIVPRVRARDLWRVPERWLEQAQDDATAVVVSDQERAGLDIITDGETRRESYSNRFATALDGVDEKNPAEVKGRDAGQVQFVPRVIGPISRRHPVQKRDVAFLRSRTDRMIKITLPGPFTLSQLLHDDFYGDKEAVALACAEAVNAEIKDLFAAGADIVQMDEPYLQARADTARQYGVRAINRAVEGVSGTTAVHLCFGYASLVKERPSGYSFLPELAAADIDQISIETAQSKLDCAVLKDLSGKTIILGVIDLSTHAVEFGGDGGGTHPPSASLCIR